MIGRQLTSDGWGQQNPHFSCRRPSRRPNLHFEAHSFLIILVFRIAYPWPWRWGSGSTCSGCQEQQDQQTCTQAESPDHSSHHRDSQGVKFIVCGVSNTALPLSRCRWSCPHPSNWVDWVARKSCRWRRCQHRSRPQKCHNCWHRLLGRNAASGGDLDDNEEVARPWWSGCCSITGVVLGGWMHFWRPVNVQFVCSVNCVGIYPSLRLRRVS